MHSSIKVSDLVYIEFVHQSLKANVFFFSLQFINWFFHWWQLNWGRIINYFIFSINQNGSMNGNALVTCQLPYCCRQMDHNAISSFHFRMIRHRNSLFGAPLMRRPPNDDDNRHCRFLFADQMRQREMSATNKSSILRLHVVIQAHHRNAITPNTADNTQAQDDSFSHWNAKIISLEIAATIETIRKQFSLIKNWPIGCFNDDFICRAKYAWISSHRRHLRRRLCNLWLSRDFWDSCDFWANAMQ